MSVAIANTSYDLEPELSGWGLGVRDSLRVGVRARVRATAAVDATQPLIRVRSEALRVEGLGLGSRVRVRV